LRPTLFSPILIPLLLIIFAKYNTLKTHNSDAAIAADYSQHCSLNRWIQTALSNSQKRSQLFIRVHNKTLSIAAVRVRNPDRSPFAIQRFGKSPSFMTTAR